MTASYQADYRTTGKKPVALDYLDGTIRHLRNALAKQRDALPKGMRNTITALLSMWGRETLGGGDSIAPGMAEIAKRAGISERMARAHYRALVNWRFIVPIREGRGRGRATVFALDIGALVRALMTMRYRISRLLIGKLRDIADVKNLAKIARRKQAGKPEMRASEKPAIKPEISTPPYIEDINTVRSAPSDRTGGKVSSKPSTARTGLVESLSSRFDRLFGSMVRKGPSRGQEFEVSRQTGNHAQSAWGFRT